MLALCLPPAAGVVLSSQFVGVSSGSRHRARKKKGHSSWTGKALMTVRGTCRQGTDESEKGGLARRCLTGKALITLTGIGQALMKVTGTGKAL